VSTVEVGLAEAEAEPDAVDDPEADEAGEEELVPQPASARAASNGVMTSAAARRMRNLI
jgi:hypothetical protein